MNDVFRTRSTHHPAGQVSVDQLVTWWHDAGMRAFLAEHSGQPVDPDDLFTGLALGARIAQEVTCGRWVVVAQLLRSGVVGAWVEVGDALGVSETAAKDGFSAWITGQRALFHSTGLGLTEAEAAHLSDLAEGVVL